MAYRYRLVLVLLILFMVTFTSQGCYTALKLRATDIPDDGCQADVYIDGSIDPYVYEYDSRYDPLFYYNPYYGYSHTGSFCSPWIYGCAESYSMHACSPGNDHAGGSTDHGSSQSDNKGQRQRGMNTISDLSPHYSQPGQGTSSSGIKSETARHIKTLRRIDTTPTRHDEPRSATSLSPAYTPQTGTHAAPSYSQQSSSVPQTSKAIPSSAKSAPPERRRGSTQ